jgi:hypothetical protein
MSTEFGKKVFVDNATPRAIDAVRRAAGTLVGVIGSPLP